LKPGYFANFGLSRGDDEDLSAWMTLRLRLSLWPHEDVAALDDVETNVLRELLPPLNIEKVRTPWRKQVKTARGLMADEARRWASSNKARTTS
jgi:hypothetical protein